MQKATFTFGQGNRQKLFALPKYLLGFILCKIMLRNPKQWIFGSGTGVAEGALQLALQLKKEDPHAQIYWAVENKNQAAQAQTHGFKPVLKNSRAGFLATLRAGKIVLTHGLGDVNRYAVFGAYTVQLWHGTTLKKLHLDTKTTLQLKAPTPARKLLEALYKIGAKQVNLYVTASPEAAKRLRSAFKVKPGLVRVLGDPRNDTLIKELTQTNAQQKWRKTILHLTKIETLNPETTRLYLYAPTWRDGAKDPQPPDPQTLQKLRQLLEHDNATLIVRSHPLGRSDWQKHADGRIHLLPNTVLADLTPTLAAFDTLITDYSSTAIDFALTGKPIVWFAPDLKQYEQNRGLYEPLQQTSGTEPVQTWAQVCETLSQLTSDSPARQRAVKRTEQLRDRFHTYQQGGAAARVLAQITADNTPKTQNTQTTETIFFESFYGRQISCNPHAIYTRLKELAPQLRYVWSVTDENQQIPDGAHPALVGSREWDTARETARVLVVNDWLRHNFKRGKNQTVLQCWHGTPLKRLALDRPHVSWRTKLAVIRESRRWSVLLSQNTHCTTVLRRCYRFRGTVLEFGYPRNDELAVFAAADDKPVRRRAARTLLGVPGEGLVLLYAPTWREGVNAGKMLLDLQGLAAFLGRRWTIVVRGHTRQGGFAEVEGSVRGKDAAAARHGSEEFTVNPGEPDSWTGSNAVERLTVDTAVNEHGEDGVSVARIIDASVHPNVNTLLKAADVLVTDYSSLMFDASVLDIAQIIYAPDLRQYEKVERGFTFDFHVFSPGPIVQKQDELLKLLQQFELADGKQNWDKVWASRREEWRQRFNALDDGEAAKRTANWILDRL